MKGRESGMPEEQMWGRFFDPACVLSRLDAGSVAGDVVEFGCGYGHFTDAIAERTQGTVYALDIDSSMLEATLRRVSSKHLSNVCVRYCDFLEQGSGLPDQSMSYAMLFNILHVEGPVALLQEVYRTLCPGGKAGIMHWNYDPATPRGPSLAIRPTPGQCQTWAEQAGLSLVRHEPLDCCPYHYGLIVERPRRL